LNSSFQANGFGSYQRVFHLGSEGDLGLSAYSAFLSSMLSKGVLTCKCVGETAVILPAMSMAFYK